MEEVCEGHLCDHYHSYWFFSDNKVRRSLYLWDLTVHSVTSLSQQNKQIALCYIHLCARNIVLNKAVQIWSRLIFLFEHNTYIIGICIKYVDGVHHCSLFSSPKDFMEFLCDRCGQNCLILHCLFLICGATFFGLKTTYIFKIASTGFFF